MVRAKTWVDTAQTREAAQHEAGAHKQHDRKRDFDYHQRLAQTAAAGGRATSSFFERVGELNSRSPKRRDEPEYDPGRQCDPAGERQHAPVETNFACARK